MGIGNHLERDFKTIAPNAKWVTDITYIKTAEGWLYPSAVKDPHQDRGLVLQAVLIALWQRRVRTPVILHSDHGCQFTSSEYQRFLKGHNLVQSMSVVGSCADNASMEGFFDMLKRERVNWNMYHTRAAARAGVFDYIKRF